MTTNSITDKPKSVSPTELVAVDFDGTLYRSPEPPSPDDSTWWFHAYSLGKPGMPGFDQRWVLSTLVAARRASLSGNTVLAVLTARPDHQEMRKALMDVLSMTGIVWDIIQLKPVFFSGSSAEYKATMVGDWLRRMPTIQKITVYDDQDDVHEVVGYLVRGTGREFVGVKV